MIPHKVVVCDLSWIIPGGEHPWVRETTLIIPRQEPKESDGAYAIRSNAYLRVALNLPPGITSVLTIRTNRSQVTCSDP